MREAWAQFEQAWRDTLVHKAEADAFKPLCDLYKVTFPETEVSESDWAYVLGLNAYGRRGTLETVFKSTERIFSQLNVKVPGVVSSANHTILVADTPWPPNAAGRLIRKGEKLHFTSHLVTATELALASHGTAYWDAPDAEDTGRYVFEILPFLIYERNPGRFVPQGINPLVQQEERFSSGEECLFEVVLLESDEVFVPKTYIDAYALKSDVVQYRSAITGGGAVLPPLNTAFVKVGDPTLYEIGNSVQVKVVRGFNAGASFTRTVVAKQGDVLQLSSPVIAYLLSESDVAVFVYRSQPDVPKGGFILPTENAIGNQQTGPFPLYAYDGLIYPEVASSMSATLAASVEYRVVVNPPT